MHFNDSLSVLLVENDPVEMDAIEAFFEEFFALHTPPCPLAIRFVRTLDEATPLLRQANGALCSASFPANAGGESSWRNALELSRAAMRLGKPAAIVTSTDDWVNAEEFKALRSAMNSPYYSIEIFGSKIDYSSHEVQLAEQKPWKPAFYGLLYLIFATRLQVMAVSEEKGMHVRYPSAEIQASLASIRDKVGHETKGTPWGLSHLILLGSIAEWANGYTLEEGFDPNFHRDIFLAHDPLTRELDDFLHGTER